MGVGAQIESAFIKSSRASQVGQVPDLPSASLATAHPEQKIIGRR
jgi:hypothetical protein